MKTQAPLKINIPEPCNQNWAAMPAVGDGKHCSKCNNIVYDFSYMSDNEVLNFFNQHTGTPCGRFHNSQLNRDITHTVNSKRILLSRFNKIAATVFTLLSFKSFSSKAELKNVKYQTAFDSDFKYKNRSDTGITIISGTVKEFGGGPLENAKVMLDAQQVAVTDKSGKFSFELSQANLEIEEPNFTSRHIYFSYDGLVTAVRNYHSAMFSTSYDVALYKFGSESFNMGMPILESDDQIGDLPSLTFKTNSSKLTTEAKAFLSVIAAKLKEHPSVNILIQGYPGMCGKQYISSYRVLNIKKYLEEKEGINPKRIATNCQVGAGDVNTVDVVVDKNCQAPH